MSKLLAIFVLALAIGSVQPAMANWQFTKWGMTPAEVVEASGGKAGPSTAEENQGMSTHDRSEIAKLGMDYDTGQFQFRVLFLFDTGDHLREVRLTLNGGTPENLDTALRAKYGQPATDKSSGDGIQVIEWYADDYVQVIKIGDPLHRYGEYHFWVFYKARSGGDTNGL